MVSFAEINGFILYASSLINLESKIEQDQSLFSCLDEILKENKGFLRLYTNLNNLSYYISINKAKNNDKINNNNSSKLFLKLMEKYYDVKDLLCSKLFSNLNIFHFLKLSKDKILLFNLAEFIPKFLK